MTDNNQDYFVALERDRIAELEDEVDGLRQLVEKRDAEARHYRDAIRRHRDRITDAPTPSDGTAADAALWAVLDDGMFAKPETVDFPDIDVSLSE